MTTRSRTVSSFDLSRRALVLGTSTALLVGGGALALLTPAAASASCSTYTDPAGDAYPESQNIPVNPNQPLINDSNLDILAVTHSTDGGVFSSAIKLSSLSATVTGGLGTGDEFKVLFTVAGKAVILDVIRDGSDPTAPAIIVTPSMTVGGTASTVVPTVKIDEKAAVLTFSLKVDDLAKAVGAPVAGQKLSVMSATAATNFGGVPQGSFRYDTATAPATAAYSVGDSCGGSAPGPGTGSGTPAPGPSGSGSPDPSGSPGPAPTGDPAAGGSGELALPRKGCADITDPTGDASPSLLGAVPVGNDSDLDITTVNFRSNATTVQAYIHVVALGSPAFPLATGHQFDALFTVNHKAVDLSGQSATAASGSIGGTASPDLKVTAAFDTKNSFVILTVDRASLEKATGGPVPDGTVLTGTSATSTQLNAPLPASKADSAQAATPAQQVYTVGSLTCFLPPPAKLAIDSDKTAQYSDLTVVYATLTDADNQPLGGVPVTARLGSGALVKAVTDGDGIAQLNVPVGAKAGAALLTAAFAGDADASATQATAPITVTTEPTVLKASGGHGSVAATLRDDDRPTGTPIAGQVVTFSYKGHTKNVTSNAKGLASLGGIPAGTAVTVSYAGSKGSYAAAKSVSAKA